MIAISIYMAVDWALVAFVWRDLVLNFFNDESNHSQYLIKSQSCYKKFRALKYVNRQWTGFFDESKKFYVLFI